jgi:Mrp family chromosome partitioning ATPase
MTKPTAVIKNTGHPWAHILWRDRLTILLSIMVMLLLALVIIFYMPRDYVASSLVTASVPQQSINWHQEAETFLSDGVIAEVQNQLFPVQSQKNFNTFRPLKLPQNWQAAPEQTNQSFANMLQQKLSVLVHHDRTQNPMGLMVVARSSNPAEAVQLARVVADSYVRMRRDEAVKLTTQKNGWIRAEVLKKRKALIEVQALYTQYHQQHGALVTLEDDVARERAVLLEDTKAEIAKNAARYGTKHPIMIELSARLNSLETPIIADDDHATLVRQTLEQLTQNIEIARVDLEQFITQHGAGLSLAPIEPDRIVLRAEKTIVKPDHSFDRTLIGVLSLCGFLFGIFFVVVRHLIHPTLQSRADIPHQLSSLSSVGALHQLKTQKQSPSPDSVMALKTMRHSLRLQFKDPKLVVITADTDHTAPLLAGLGLARVAAKAGEKSIIIEANWHHCYLHHFVANTKDRTMIDYVAGSASLESILNRDDPSGAHIIYGGEIPMTAIDLLSGTKFANLLLSFRQIYDLVVLVAPPVTLGADARVLAKMADLTILTMVADVSHPQSLSAAVAILQDANISEVATLWVD